MEYCEGGDLTDLIREAADRGEVISQTKAMRWFVQLCEALRYVHALHVVHRDIKSPNVFVSEGQVLKLGDFGLSALTK